MYSDIDVFANILYICTHGQFVGILLKTPIKSFGGITVINIHKYRQRHDELVLINRYAGHPLL